jgi:hypothetical protein
MSSATKNSGTDFVKIDNYYFNKDAILYNEYDESSKYDTGMILVNLITGKKIDIYVYSRQEGKNCTSGKQEAKKILDGLNFFEINNYYFNKDAILYNEYDGSSEYDTGIINVNLITGTKMEIYVHSKEKAKDILNNLVKPKKTINKIEK